MLSSELDHCEVSALTYLISQIVLCSDHSSVEELEMQ